MTKPYSWVLPAFLFASFLNAQVTINVPAGGNVAAAVAAAGAAGGGTVNLAAGTYSVTSPILMQSNVTLSGAGSSTILQAPITPNAMTVIAGAGDGVNNITIQNLVVDGNIPSGAFLPLPSLLNPYSDTGISFSAVTTQIQSLTIQNVEVKNAATGLYLNNVNNVALSGLYIHDNNPGGSSYNAEFVNCTLVTIQQSRFLASHYNAGLYALNVGFELILNSEFSRNNGPGLSSTGGNFQSIQTSVFDYNAGDGLMTDNPANQISQVRADYNGGYGINILPAGSTGESDSFVAVGNALGFGQFNGEPYTNYLVTETPTPNVYPAVLASGVLGANSTADWSTGYPGYTSIGSVDFNSNYSTNGLLTFSHVGVVSAGSYSLTLAYLNYFSGPVQMALTVNGTSAGLLSFPSTGSSWGTVNFTAPLQAGNNVIAVSVQPGGAPELDYLQVNTSVPAVPSTPLCLSATATGPYSIALNWSPATGATTYHISRSTSPGGPFSVIASSVTATTYTDSRILMGATTYYYMVTPNNPGGSGGTSSVVSATTPIDAPAGLMATGTGASVSLSWIGANGAAGYSLKRATLPGGPYTTIATVTNTASLAASNFTQTYTDTTAVAGTVYFYVASAVSAAGLESANSYEVNNAANTSGGNFSLALGSSSVSLAPGGTFTLSLSVNTAAGFTAPVTLSAASLPPGVSAMFSPSVVTGSAMVASTPVTVTLTSASGTAGGTSVLEILGTAGTSVYPAVALLTLGVSQTISFSPLGSQAAGTPALLTATASSGLAVSYAVSPSSVCALNGGEILFIAPGICTVTASQPGNSTYAAAPSLTQTLQVNAPGFSLSIAPSLSLQAGGTAKSSLTVSTAACYSTPISLTASGLPSGVTASISPATITAGTAASSTTATVSLTAASTASAGTSNPIFFGVAGAEIHGVATTLTVSSGAQSITFGTIATQTAGTSLTLTATASSGLAVSYASSTTAVCTVSGSAASLIASGTCTITASQSGNSVYQAATPVTQTFTVNPRTQTITFGTISSQTVGTPLTLTASASSGLAVSYTSSTTAVCTASGTTVTLLTAGTCTITAAQPGNTLYAAAASVPQSFAVTQAGQTISFATIPAQTVGSQVALTATASSGLPVSFTSSTPSVCSLNSVTTLVNLNALNTNNGAFVTLTLAPGTYTVAPVGVTTSGALYNGWNSSAGASSNNLWSDRFGVQFGSADQLVVVQNGNPGYATDVAALAAFNSASTLVVQDMSTNYTVINGAMSNPYTFTLTSTQNVTLSIPDIAGLFGDNSGGLSLLVTQLAASNSAIMVAAGTCTVTASQSGSATYAAAAPVSQSFAVAARSQTISFAAPATQTVGTPLTLSATASSGLAVSFASSTAGVCTVSGGTATFIASGTCTIVASQTGNAVYSAASSVTQSFTVAGKSQTLTYTALGSQYYYGTYQALSFSSSSGLTVTLTSATPSVCTIYQGNTVQNQTTGICTIVFTQAGNSTYAPASASETYTIVQYSQTITFGSIGNQVVGTPLTLSATSTSGLAVTFASSTTGVCTVSGTTATFVAAGTCTIVASQSGSAYYSAAPSVSQSFTVYRVLSPNTCNVYGKSPNQCVPNNGGHDNNGYAYCDSLLGTALTVAGIPFQLGPSSSPYAFWGTTVSLPAGNYSSVKFLAAGVNGQQPTQAFTITYTDGTSGTVYQSLSDWCSSSGYSGETIASTMPYRITPTGGQQTGTINIYQYSIPCNSAKTVQSVTLPPNRNVVVHAITLCP